MCIGKLFHYSDLVMSSGASTVAVGCPATPVCQAPGCRRSQQVFRLICPVGQFVCVCLCVCARAKCRSSEKWTLNSYKGPTSIPNPRQYSPWVQLIPPTPTSTDIPFFPTEKIHSLFASWDVWVLSMRCCACNSSDLRTCRTCASTHHVRDWTVRQALCRACSYLLVLNLEDTTPT